MLDQELKLALQSVSFHVLLLTTARLFNRIGYSDVEELGRRTARRPADYRGADLRLRQPLPLFPTVTLAKIVQTDIQQEVVDEMIGVKAREQADYAVIVTPFGIADSVQSRRAALVARRIRLIDGEELARLAIAQGIAVREGTKEPSVDYPYLHGLEQLSGRIRKISRSLKREFKA